MNEKYREEKSKSKEQADKIRKELKEADVEHGHFVDYNDISDEELIRRKREEDKLLGREDLWANDRR